MYKETDICVLGIDYKMADYLVRSRFAFTATQKMAFSAQLIELGCSDVVILSTCNRSEVYFIPSNCSSETVETAFKHFFNAEDIKQKFYLLEGENALRHLFFVTAGIKSSVIGEDQILGQVRKAYEDAVAFGCAGKMMTRIFQSAILAAKQIKTEICISAIPISTVYVGIKLLKEMLGGFTGKRVLIIGTGEMSMLAVKYLSEEQIEKLYICARSCANINLPTEFDCEMIPFASRYDYFTQVDAIITATSSPHSIIEASSMKPLTSPLYILDMAVPPDVDTSVYAMDNISVINIDHLHTETTENIKKRKQLSEKAGQIIEENLQALRKWMFHSRVDGILASLNNLCNDIAADTEQYLENKIQVPDREKKLIYKMLEASLHRLIREPVLYLKSIDNSGQQDEYIRAVETLFNI